MREMRPGPFARSGGALGLTSPLREPVASLREHPVPHLDDRAGHAARAPITLPDWAEVKMELISLLRRRVQRVK